jgi:prepilin-type N-terminal cleavage/methylation domain-containing protein
MQIISRQSGFTLIEMLVSLALFTIVATISVGTLLVLINGNSKVVGEQSVMTGLTFALDSMSREIRTGTDYFCGSIVQVTGNAVTGSSTNVSNCTSGNVGLSFREAGESITGGSSQGRIAYYFDNNMMYRKIGTGTPVPIIGDDIRVTSARFVVTGSEKLTANLTDKLQPTVTLVLTAVASSSDNTTPFTVQTTVTQRALDI